MYNAFDGTKVEIAYLTIIITCILTETFITFGWKGFILSFALMLMSMSWAVSYIKEQKK